MKYFFLWYKVQEFSVSVIIFQVYKKFSELHFFGFFLLACWPFWFLFYWNIIFRDLELVKWSVNFFNNDHLKLAKIQLQYLCLIFPLGFHAHALFCILNTIVKAECQALYSSQPNVPWKIKIAIRNLMVTG